MQVTHGNRQLRVTLVPSHACPGLSHRDACQLSALKQLGLLCAAIALLLLSYHALIRRRNTRLVLLRLSTLTTTKRRAELGPKSQRRDCKHRYLLFALLLLISHTSLAEGAGTGPGKLRVVIGPATMMGASTGSHTSATTREAKTCAEGPQRQSTAIRKIAFRRATARARSAGLAQYRGRTLRAVQSTDPPSQQSPLLEPRRSHNPPRPLVRTGRITVMSYNAGGLSTHHYTQNCLPGFTSRKGTDRAPTLS